MTVDNGFENKPTEISINVESRVIHLWIKHTSGAIQDQLLYLTATELHSLLCEVQDAARELFDL